MFYNPNGTAITPGNVLFGTAGGRDLWKPDITAADCVTTTSPVPFNPFCGTSAAAPHAAAIAALLKSADNHPGSGQVLAAMFTTALDVTPGTGWDRNSGVGLVMADRALAGLTTVPALDFYSVEPCRVVDTRTTGGALSCGTERVVPMTGACGVPADAKAVSVNLTATDASTSGNLRLFAAGSPQPLVSSLNYVPGVNRANNAISPLNASGQMAILCSPTGTVNAIVDVNGYFR
jgi:subtilisin family serine protease